MIGFFTGLTTTQVSALNQAFLHTQLTALPRCELVGMRLRVRFEDGSEHVVERQPSGGWTVDPPEETAEVL